MEVKKRVFDIHLDLRLGPLQRTFQITSSHLRLGIMGPSGSGKTTLAQAVAGINQSVSGEFVFQAKTYLRTKDKVCTPAWERNFGYLPQDFLLLPHLTVKQNILFPRMSKLLLEVVEGLQIKPLMDRMPRNLSGGEKQRVAMARALCSSPELLILDEPFASLDSKTKRATIEFLHGFALHRSLPLFVISHGEKELESLECEISSLDS